ncbi:phage tail length tape measure family protein [Aureimonas sp. D3]|uniref:phage tail length tape measure family protein n=1 Tax=Aureimonas sp. D3 TaxID=1638164 RepID=UPI000783BA56|nr:phage tail length tape measure family protein [Aureimonas sp. D3]
MAAREITRKLTVKADTSGLKQASAELVSFDAKGRTVVDMLRNAKQSMSAVDYRAFAKNMQFAVQAEREMAQMAKVVAAELKPFAAEMRRVQTEALKQAEAINKRSLSEMRAAENLRKAFDTQYASSQKYLGVEAQVKRQIELRNLTVEQGNTILANAAKRYGQAANDLGAMGQRARLTSGQVQGLGYQLNDVGTMLAMGASPFQIMASQAGQVLQVLQEGGGIKASLAAIGSNILSFAKSIPGTAYAVAGLTAAVGALWYMTKGPEAREAEERLKDFEGAIKRLETGWKSAADAARDYANAPTRQATDPNATFLDVRGSAKRLHTDLKAAINDLNTSDLLSGRILRPFSGHVSDARRQIMSLYTELRTGGISAQQFADEMLRIRLDPNAEVHARNLAEEIRLALPDVVALERQVQALNQATAKMAAPKGTMGRHDLPEGVFKDRFGPIIGGDNRFGSTEAMDGIREGLKGQREELEKTDKAVRTYSDAVNEQKAALAGSLAELQLQIDMFGQSEGAIASAKFKMDAMADAQRAATEAKQSAIDPSLVEQINREAAEYGRLTDQLNAATKAQQDRLRVEQEAEAQRKRVSDFEADLAFDRSILTLPQAEQQVRSTLRGLGVDFNSFEGQRIAQAMRYNEAIRAQQEELSKTGNIVDKLGDIFSDVFSSATRDGENFFSSVMRGLAGLGNQLAASGAKSIFGKLFGTGQAEAPATGMRIAANAPAMSYTPSASPKDFGEAAAAVSGQVLSYAGRFNKAVDGRLMTVIQTAAQNFPYRVEAVSGLRPGDSRYHGKGLAADVQIYDAKGKALSNYQDASTFRVYEQFAQQAKVAQEKLFPELGKLFRWGGYFSGGKGKYGALDSMHFDIGGAGMAGGSWENGLTPAQRSLWKGIQSIGMGSSSADTRLVARGVTQGMHDFARSGSVEGYDRGQFDAGTPSNPAGGMSRGQAVMGGLFGLAGIAANGYQSGSPIMGGVSGAMGGFELGSSLGTAFPSIAGVAGPAGMAVGALAGCVGGKMETKAQREARRAA